MKKVKSILILLLLAVIVIPFNNIHADDKITVYMFRGEGCPHCEEALKFFDKLSQREKYSKLYNLKTYEVWNSEENQELMEKVAAELGEEASGVPYIVIGEKTFSGYSAEYDTQIKEAIKNAYNDKDYKDVVKTILKGQSKKDKAKEDFPIVPVTITIGCAVLIIVGLVILTKKL